MEDKVKQAKQLAKIELSAMKFYASHGCYATEKQVGGRFEVTLSYLYDATTTIANDDVKCAVNYLDVYDEVRTQMMVSSDTIENVCHRVCTGLLARCPAMQSVKVSISKITPPLGGDIARVSATLEVNR